MLARSASTSRQQQQPRERPVHFASRSNLRDDARHHRTGSSSFVGTSTGSAAATRAWQSPSSIARASKIQGAQPVVPTKQEFAVGSQRESQATALSSVELRGHGGMQHSGSTSELSSFLSMDDDDDEDQLEAQGRKQRLRRRLNKASSLLRSIVLNRNKAQQQPPPSGADKQTTTARPDRYGKVAPEATGGFADLSERFMLKAKETVVKAVRKRFLNSRTPAQERPQTWSEYRRAYQANEIDIEDPPLPPPKQDVNSEPSPYEAQAFDPPVAPNEAERQRTIDRLDLFGRWGRAHAPSALDLARSQGSATPRPVSLEQGGPADSEAPSTPTREPRTRVRSGVSESSSAPSTAHTRSSSLDDTPSTTATSVHHQQQQVQQQQDPETVASVRAYPAFQELVTKCTETFGTPVAMISLLDGGMQYFLASVGLPGDLGDTGMPRALSFCAHTVLNGNEGMVILDSSKDWRFAGAAPTAALGVRFYAGYPLVARNMENPTAEPVALGSICVLDLAPRESFSAHERAQLKQLAVTASREVEKFVAQRLEAKLRKIEASFQTWQKTSEPARISSQFESSEQLAGPALPSSPQGSSASRSLKGKPSLTGSSSGSISHHKKSTSDLRSAASATRRRRGGGKGVNAAAARLQLALDATAAFERGVKLLGETLELSLVYLVALDIPPPSAQHQQQAPVVNLLAAYGLDRALVFDPWLHLRALRAPEGGILYQNPDASAEHDSSSGGGAYASGVLLRTVEIPKLDNNNGSSGGGEGKDEGRSAGYVLCAFTKSARRVLGTEDIAYMSKLSEELERFCVAL